MMMQKKKNFYEGYIARTDSSIISAGFIAAVFLLLSLTLNVHATVANITLPTNSVNTTAKLFQWADGAITQDGGLPGMLALGIDIVIFMIIFGGTVFTGGNPIVGLTVAGAVTTIASLALIGIGLGGASVLAIGFFAATLLGMVLLMTKGITNVY